MSEEKKVVEDESASKETQTSNLDKDVKDAENLKKTNEKSENSSSKDETATKKETSETLKAKESKETKKSSKDEAKKEKKVKKSHLEVQIDKLKSEIASLKEKNKKDAEEYLKARADLDNIRKRLIDDNAENRKYASQKLIESLVTPVDMLVKVCQTEVDDEKMKNFLIGFQMIANQINDALLKDGLKEIKALNEEFDSNYHQAVSKEKKEGVKPGIVIEVLQAGYTYKDHLIRPAMVKVSE